MKCNVGGAERVIRIILGLVALSFAYLSPTGVWAAAGYIVGGIVLLTGLIRFCPVSALLGISSCPE
jgi:hypothetical protein